MSGYKPGEKITGVVRYPGDGDSSHIVPGGGGDGLYEPVV